MKRVKSFDARIVVGSSMGLLIVALLAGCGSPETRSGSAGDTGKVEPKPLVVAESEAFSSKLRHALVQMTTGTAQERDSAYTALEKIVAEHGESPTFRAEVAYLSADEYPREMRLWACRALERLGDESSVEWLEEAMRSSDPAVSEAARLALEGNPSAAASAALRAALEASKSSVGKIAYANALGARRDGASVGLLSGLLKSPDRDVVRAGLAALGEIGSASTLEPLLLELESGPRDLHSSAANALLRAAEQRLAAGHPATAMKVYRTLYESQLASHFRFAGLRGWALASEDSYAVLRRAICKEISTEQAGSRALAQSALRLVADLPGRAVTRALEADYAKVDPSLRPLVIEVIGLRGEARSMAFLKGELLSQRRDVHEAILRAIGDIGDCGCAGLLAQEASGGDPAARLLAREALLRLRGEDCDEKMLAKLDGSSNSAGMRRELIRALAGRRVHAALPRLLELIEEPRVGIRLAAIAAVARLGEAQHAPQLLGRLLIEPERKARRALEDAVVDVTARGSDVTGRNEVVMEAWPRATGAARVSLLRVLGRFGGVPALEAAREALADPDAVVVDGAVRMLSDWKDPSVAAPGVIEVLAGIVDRTTVPKHRALALRGYLRLIREQHGSALTDEASSAQAERRVRQLQTAKHWVRDDNERRLLLSAFGTVAHRVALAEARSFLEVDTLCNEAAVAVADIAWCLVATHAEEARAALQELETLDLSEVARERLEEVLQQSQIFEGSLVRWMAGGPISVDGADAADLFDASFWPEPTAFGSKGGNEGADAFVTDDGREVGLWEELTARSADNPYVFDLTRLPTGKQANQLLYLRTTFEATHALPALLEIGSDDGVKVWLNHELVHTSRLSRGLTCGEDKVPVELKPGVNTLLVKIVQGSGGWAFSCQLKKPGGEGVPAGVKLNTN